MWLYRWHWLFGAVGFLCHEHAVWELRNHDRIGDVILPAMVRLARRRISILRFEQTVTGAAALQAELETIEDLALSCRECRLLLVSLGEKSAA